MDCLKNISTKNTYLEILKKTKTLFILVLMFFSGVFSVNAQCPSIASTNQSFCDIQPPTIADLQAIDNGSGFSWYDTATSTEILPLGTGLANGEDYYLDNAAGNCGTRIKVTVSLYTAPLGPNFQGICVSALNQATLASLYAIGNNVQWYSQPFGGAALPLTTIVTSGSTYYAGQTNPITGCLTSRLPVSVAVNVVLGPTGDAVQNFCNTTGNPPKVGDLVASGINNWYFTSTSALVLSLNTPLVNGHVYYGTNVSAPCESTQKLQVLVNLIPENNAGINNTVSICETSLTSGTALNLFNQLGGTPSNLGFWSGPRTTTNGSLGSLDTSTLSVSGSPYIFTYTVNDSTICPPATASVTVIVEPTVNAGTDAAITFCKNGTPTNLFTLLGGNPNQGGTWFPALASGTSVFNPSVDNPGVYTYTVLGNSACPTDFATVTVTVDDLLDAGISGTITICQTTLSGGGFINLFNNLSGTPSSLGFWSGPVATINGNLGTVDISTLTFSGSPYVFTYTVNNSVVCPSATSTVTIFIEAPLNAGTDGVIALCENSPSVNLFTFLGGNPNIGGTWSPQLSSGTGIFNPNVDLPGVYTYTLSNSVACVSDAAIVTVTINELLDAGISEAITLCENNSSTGAPVNLFEILGGTPSNLGFWSGPFTTTNGHLGTLDSSVLSLSGSPYVFTYNLNSSTSCPSVSTTVTIIIEAAIFAGNDSVITVCQNNGSTNLFTLLGTTANTGGTWSPALSSGTGVFNPAIDPSGVYTYTLSGSVSCPSDSATVTVNVVQSLNAGVDATKTFCQSEPSFNLFTLLGTTANAGGTWSPALSSGTGFFNPAVDPAGIYTYTLSGSVSCPGDSATVTVNVVQSLNAGVDATKTFCQSEPSFNLFTLLGTTANTGGTWSPALSSGTGFFNPAIDPSGVYTYTLISTNICPNDTATVTVIVDKLPTITLANVVIGTICLDNVGIISITNATNLSNGTYQLSYQISGAIIYTNTISVVFQNGASNFTIPASVLNSPGNSSLTINPIQSNIGNSCGISAHFFNPVSFTLEATSTPIFNGISEFCNTDNATIVNLTDGINNPLSVVWYDAATNGIAYPNNTSLINGTTYYAASVSTSGCESTVRLAVTVTVKDCQDIIIPDGFSPNGDGINETFEIKNIRTLFPNFTIVIYNRWGNVLFEGNASKPDWDGNNEKGMKISGSKLPIGVYFYILNFNDNTKKDIQGRLYLSR